MKPRRILCIGEYWQGSDARSVFEALRRLGNLVHVIDEWHYIPLTWRSTPARAARKALRPILARELANDAIRLMDRFRPDALLVFKGTHVLPEVISAASTRGIVTANIFPDISVFAYGPHIPAALPLYDHVFTTKSFGVGDMRRDLGITHATFLEPGYDPELHRPVALTPEERDRFACEVVFVGTWTPKKERLISKLKREAPRLDLKIWGNLWGPARSRRPELAESIMGEEIVGEDYPRALQGAKICLGLLTEILPGASSGDFITARTFQIPACGAFMLHERNDEAMRYFREGEEAGFFNEEDIADQVAEWMGRPEARESAAAGGLRRSRNSGYSIDERMKTVLAWLEAKLAGRRGARRAAAAGAPA